jgi:hypothetical protein
MGTKISFGKSEKRLDSPIKQTARRANQCRDARHTGGHWGALLTLFAITKARSGPVGIAAAATFCYDVFLQCVF